MITIIYTNQSSNWFFNNVKASFLPVHSNFGGGGGTGSGGRGNDNRDEEEERALRRKIEEHKRKLKQLAREVGGQ